MAFVLPKRITRRARQFANCGLTSGFPAWDQLGPGFLSGGLYVIAGRPGMGKTSHLEQVSIRTLEDWAERGDGPPFRKAGRKTSRRRYPLGSYLDWREQTTMTCTIEKHRNVR